MLREIHYYTPRLLPPGRRPEKSPNVPYLSKPIGQIETLRKSKIHYVFQHIKLKLFLQPTLRNSDQ